MSPEIFLKISLDNQKSFKSIKEGEKLFNQRKIEDALKFFEKMEKECELFKSTYYVLTGITTFGLALPLAKMILNSSVDPVYKGLAHCYFWNKNYIKSIKNFDKISKKDFTDLYVEAWANYKIGNIEKSKTLFSKSIEKNPSLSKYQLPIDLHSRR